MKFKFLLTAAIPLLLAACDNDESGNGIEDADAIAFTASIQPVQATTRLTTNDSWAGLSDSKVAISIDGTVKEYAVDETGVLASLTPFCWEGRTGVTVNAWYPYNEGVKPEVIVSADQSVGTNYLKSDFLEVAEAAVTPESTALTFVHRTAKVVCSLKNENGSSNGSQVILKELTGVDKGSSIVTTGDYRALLAPQTVLAGTNFITVVLSDKRSYVYKLKEDLVLQPGHVCLIDLFFTPTGLDATIKDSSTWIGDADNVDGSTATNTPDINGGSWEGNNNTGVEGNESTTGTNIGNSDVSGQWAGGSTSVEATESN